MQPKTALLCSDFGVKPFYRGDNASVERPFAQIVLGPDFECLTCILDYLRKQINVKLVNMLRTGFCSIPLTFFCIFN